MRRYILVRLAGLLPVLLGISVLVFLVMHLAPGDPALIMLGPHATAESLAQLRRDFGLDLPLPVQYFRWVGHLLSGDWGWSLHFKRSVMELLGQRFPATLILAVAAMAIAVAIGVPAGILSAARQYSLLDRSAMVTALLGFSIPVFWLGMLFQIAFGLRLGWLPISGMYDPGSTAPRDLVVHLLLPAVTLATGPAALVARMTRSSMLEVIRQDYIRTAWAKGLGERLVISRHALRNAMIPTVTVVGMQAGYLLGGEVLVEMVFNWPGLGLMMVNGILARDFPLVQGAILLVAGIYVLMNIIVDVAYAYLDPRISYG